MRSNLKTLNTPNRNKIKQRLLKMCINESKTKRNAKINVLRNQIARKKLILDNFKKLENEGEFFFTSKDREYILISIEESIRLEKLQDEEVKAEQFYEGMLEDEIQRLGSEMQ